jgi:hypothetical protein
MIQEQYMKNKAIGQAQISNNYNHNFNQLNAQYGFQNQNGMPLAAVSTSTLSKGQPNPPVVQQAQFYQQ